MKLRIWKQRSMGLRARLTLSYAVGFTLVLLLLGLVVRARFDMVVRDGAESVLDDEAATIRNFVHVENGKLQWTFDTSLNEEAFFVRRLRRILLITDESGHTLEVSDAYRRLGPEPPDVLKAMFSQQLPRLKVRLDRVGARFLLRTDIIQLQGKPYLVTLGRELDEAGLIRAFTLSYYLFVWPLCAAMALLGWWLAGRGLKPLNEVALAAQAVSSSNLHTLIPMRGADDELDHLISTFNSMTERLEVSFSQMKHFSTDISHELRTPLTTIRGQLEVALFTAQSEAQMRESMFASIEEVDHLSRVVTALLQLAAAESGQLVVSRERLDFGLLCRGVALKFEDAADMQNLSLKIACESGCFVQGDRTQLERLVTNLVANAMKYTPAGGNISVQARAVDDNAMLSVEDTGRGIAPQHLPHIFDRFYRVAKHNGDPARGLGLGLSFVAWITKAHWGHIDVKSELGQGSTFRVSLPIYAASSSSKGLP